VIEVPKGMTVFALADYVRSAYPNAKMVYRDSSGQKRYRVSTGVDGHKIWLTSDWQSSERHAWRRAYQHVKKQEQRT
jgi:hypothetical protein